MQRILLTAALIAALAAGCNTNRSRPRQESPAPYRAREAPPPNKEQSAERVANRTAAGDPAWYPRSGKISPRWTTIVVHHSATAGGGARSFDRFHRDKGWDELGYHFVIGNGSDTPDGFIEVGARWHKQKHGAHCKTPDNYFNDHGIGVCLVGDFTKSRPTARQLAALERLTSFLCDRCGISPSRVVSHQSVTHKTACPGRFLPMASIRRSLASASAAGRVY
jgi:hypothetical protein